MKQTLHCEECERDVGELVIRSAGRFRTSSEWNYLNLCEHITQRKADNWADRECSDYADYTAGAA
jgi:hypothetical protein